MSNLADPTPAPVVLIVEDDAAVADVVSRLIAAHGFAPLTVASSTEAMAAIRERHVVAVVLDVDLDEVDGGVDFLKWLRRQPAHADTPVGIFTGLMEFDDADRHGVEIFGATVFYKPNGIDALIQFLKTGTNRE